jgi:amino acid transporter
MFVGFESAGTLGEETKDARRAIPIALFSAVGIIGIFYVLSSYTAAIGFGSGAGSHALANDASPFNTLANKNWSSSVAWIVSLTVINSQFANVISGSNASVRMIFSLGRERLLPRILARTNAKGSPIAAWIAYASIATVLTLGLGAAMGPLGVYAFMGTALGLGIILIYISINLAFMRWMWVHERNNFSVLRHAVVPVIASLLLLLPIWGQIHPYPAYPISLVPPIVVLLILSGIFYYLYLRSRSPDIVAGMGRVWGDEAAAAEPVSGEPSTELPQLGVA